MSQFDLFAAPAARPAPPRPVPPPALIQSQLTREIPALPIPRCCEMWERLVRTSNAPLIVVVSTLRTGEILEVLSCPLHGRRWLGRTGTMGEFPPDSTHCRVVHATLAEAREWHKKRALVPLGVTGTSCARFTFADSPGAEPLAFPHPFQEPANAG